MKLCLTIFCLFALSGVINSANLACEAGKEQGLQTSCTACGPTYLICGDKSLALFETAHASGTNYDATATAFGVLCKSNQFFNANAGAADTCDVGPKECKTSASTTTCASCWPGWYQKADTKCYECPEQFAYTGCKWNSGTSLVEKSTVSLTECQTGFTLDASDPKICIPCVGDGVAECTAVTGATIAHDAAGAYEQCMQGFFFTGEGSYTVSGLITTVLNNGAGTTVNGTATIAQSDAGQCRMCPDQCWEQGYDSCKGQSNDGKWMTTYDYVTDSNTTFRGVCECSEGLLYQDAPWGGMCVDECMFGFYTPEDLKATKCGQCHDSCEECYGPSAMECYICSPWAFMVEGQDGMCVSECPKGYKQVGSNTTSFNSQFCEEDQDVDGGFDLATDVVDPTCSGLNCVACSGPAENQCLTCSGNSFLFEGICQSECPRGFFENKQSLTCQACHPKCETCYGSNPEDCLSCKTTIIESNVGIFNLYDEQAKECHQTCPRNSYKLSGENICASCGENCDVCDQAKANAGQCLACNSKTVLVLGQCHNSCPKGFFMGELTLTATLSERICMPCGNGCADCIDEGLCYECKGTKKLSSKDPSMCVTDCTLLPDNFAVANYKYFNNATMGGVCQEQPSYCTVGNGILNATAKFGEGSATECTAYIKDATTDNTIPLPLYGVNGTVRYMTVNSTNNDNTVILANKKYTMCAANEWISQASDNAVGVCNKCELTLPGCASCSNANTCFKCKKAAVGDFTTWKKLLFRCVEECPPGTYSDQNNECMPCDGCSECTGAAKTDCTSCDRMWGQDFDTDNVTVLADWKGLFKPTTDQVKEIGGIKVTFVERGVEVKGQCVKTCGAGYYMARNQRECLPCNSMCATCFDDTQYCLTPKTGKAEFMGRFYDSCPTGMIKTPTTVGNSTWDACSCSDDCTTDSCFIEEEMHEEFCYACKNNTYWSFEEIGKCYTATKKCPASLTTPWGDVLPVYPDARDATAKICSFKCPSGTYKNLLGGSTNENNTCVSDCTNKTVVTNWNNLLHVVDKWSYSCKDINEGCSFGYGLKQTCSDAADPTTCRWSCDFCPSKCADCHMVDDDWCPVCATGYMRHFGAWGIEECIGGGNDEECAAGYQKQQVGYFHYYDDEDTVDYDLVVDSFESKYADKFDNTAFEVDGCLLTDAACLGTRNDTCNTNCTGEITSDVYMTCMDARFDANCDGDNIPTGATKGGLVFNDDSQFDYDTENFTIIVAGVEQTFTNETKGDLEVADVAPPLRMLAKTEYEEQLEDDADLKTFAAGLDKEDKHKTYAVGKDGSVEEFGMSTLVDDEDIAMYEEMMVGSQEQFGAGASSVYCIPCEFNCNTCPEGFFEQETQMLTWDENQYNASDPDSGFVTETAKNCREECDLGDFAQFQNKYNTTSYTLDASDFDAFYEFMSVLAPDMFNWRMSCLVNNAPSIRKLTGGLIKHPISQPLFIGADVAKLRGASYTWEIVSSTQNLTYDQKLGLLDQTSTGFFEEDSDEGYCDLVIPIKVLKAGQRYKFRLNVSNSEGNDSATWEVEIERGMKVGTFAVSPAVGKAMTTDFELTIGGYTYPNGSLFFQVYAYITDVFDHEVSANDTAATVPAARLLQAKVAQVAGSEEAKTEPITADVVDTKQKTSEKAQGPGDKSLKEMMDGGDFGEGLDFDVEDMESADDWEDLWTYYAEDYTYTVVWELTHGPEILPTGGDSLKFYYTFPDDESLMMDNQKLSLEVSIFSYEFPWVWHFQEFKDFIAIEALTDAELDTMMDAFFAGEQTFATPAAASNFMDSAFTKNFGDMDTYESDADDFWAAGNTVHADTLKGKGQVGVINTDHIDFQALLYTVEDMTFEEMQTYGCSLYACNTTGTLETEGEGCKLNSEDGEYWMECNCKENFFGPKCKDDAAANTKKKQYFNQSITQVTALLNTDGTMDSSKAKDAMKMIEKMFKVSDSMEVTKEQMDTQMSMLAATLTVVPITDSAGLASASKSIMSALNNQKTDVKGDRYAAKFNETQVTAVNGRLLAVANTTEPNTEQMKAQWVAYCNSSSAQQAQLYISKALSKPTQSAAEWAANSTTNKELCVDPLVTNEILYRASLKYYAFNEKKQKTSTLLTAEGKVIEKAAAVTTTAAPLTQTSTDKVTNVAVIDQTKTSTISATPTTQVTAAASTTTTTAATTTTGTTRRLQTSTSNSATATTATTGYTASASVPTSVYTHSNFVGYSSFQVQIAQYTSNPLPQKTTDNLVTNVVDLKIYGKNSAGTSVVLNAWDTSALTINIPKTVDTSSLNTDNTTTAASKYICKYWDSTYLIWKTDGCTLKSEETTYFVCECTHTTEFAVALDSSAVTAKTTAVVSVTTAGSSVVFNMMFAVIALVFMFMQ